MKVLVVGGAGYVGSHMVKHLLTRGHDVTVFDNLSRGHRESALSAHFVNGDLLEHSSLESLFKARNIEVVMHFAAFCYVGESMQLPHLYYRNNVVGTLNLLDAMRNHGVKSFVFSSTCATYGYPVETTMRETHPQQPINPYGASKLMVERVLRDYGDAHGLSSVALRYFNAAGSDPDGELGERHDPETHLIPLALLEARRVQGGGDPAITSLAVHGNDYETPDGTCVRDYVHVDDLASAHMAAASHLVDGSFAGARAYNLGSERGYSVLEVIECCRKVTGVPIQYKFGPRRPGDPPRLVATSALAKRELGWRPQYVNLEKTVETAWQWFSRT